MIYSGAKQYYRSARVLEKSLITRIKMMSSVRESIRKANSIALSVKKASFLVESGSSGFYRNLGLALIASAPIPVVSEVVGSFLVALAIAREYRCRRSVNSMLSCKISDLVSECLSVSL